MPCIPEWPIDAIANRFEGQHVAVVTHGGSLGALFRHAIGLAANAPRHFELRNCAINRFLIRSDGWHIDLWGDTAHFEKTALDELTADTAAP